MWFKSIITVFSLVIGFLLIVPASFAAENYASGQTITLPKNEKVTGDYFASGKSVVIDGTIDGDVYIWGGEVRIDGTVTGDVLAAGGNVQVNGKVAGDIRAVGGQVLVAGDIGRNISLAGGSVSVQNQAKVPGSVAAAGGSLALFSPIGKNLTVAGGEVRVNNTINGNIRGAVGQLTLLPQAKISGKLDYWSQQKADIKPGASVSGTTTFHQMQEKKEVPKEAVIGAAIIWFIINFLAAFIVGLVLLFLAPLYMDHISEVVWESPWLSLGIGVLGVIVFPIVIVLLLMTLIGIPLGLILLATFLILMYLSKIVIAYAIGDRMLPNHRVWALFVGLLIYEIVALIPVIGWLATTIACLIGFGALLLGERHFYLLLRQKKIM